jgi:drug/metabolite transporter (DMT)-like permease
MLAFIGAILFSTKAVLVKLAYQYEIDTSSLLMLRMLFALPFFLIAAIRLIGKYPDQKKQINTYKYHLLVYGLLGYYMASYLDLEGLHYIDASLERIIIFIYPTLVVLLSLFWLKQRLTFPQTISILVCYVGIIIAYLGNINIASSDDTLRGSLFVMGSALAYSIYLVGSQKMVTRMNSRLYNSMAMCIACIAIIIHNYITNGFNLFDFQLEIYLYALLIATIATVIPSFLIVEGIRIIGANNSSIIGTIGPISTIILAGIFLNERINITQGIGTLIVISGVLYLILNKRK